MTTTTAQRLADELELADMYEQLPYTVALLKEAEKALTSQVERSSQVYGSNSRTWPVSALNAVSVLTERLVELAQRYCRELERTQELELALA